MTRPYPAGIEAGSEHHLAPLMILVALISVTAGAIPMAAQDRPHAFEGARILPIVGEPIERGVLLVHEGRIVDIGAEGRVDVPDDAVVHDLTGKVIMPGLVDTHSHIGGGDGGDRSGALHPNVRILDALNARDESLQRAQAGGITTANVMPGSGHLMSGQTAYIKLRDAGTIEELLLCADPLHDICGGMKMANGTNPRGDQPFPGTRAKAAAMVREKYTAAQDYRRKLEQAADDPDRAPDRDLEMEALVEVLDGRRVVHHHTHRHDDILTVLRLADEFGFRVVLHHVSEAWKVADEIAAAGVPASIIVLDAPGGKLEASEIRLENGAALEESGALVAYHTDDYITDSRLFLRSAGLGVRAGMSREAALNAMTMAGARMLGLEDRIGSLEPGKDADLVVLSGDPLSVYTRVEQTWVDGEKVFDLSDPRDHAYAVGGWKIRQDGDRDHHGSMEGHR